jgi:hypothetical protein
MLSTSFFEERPGSVQPGKGLNRTQHSEKRIITARGNGAKNRDAFRKVILARKCQVLPDQFSPI